MKLSEYLSAKNLTLEEFAETSGISIASISRLINGKQYPGSKAVARIEKATRGQVTRADLHGVAP